MIAYSAFGDPVFTFSWDIEKELQNFKKHGFNFDVAKEVFRDPDVIHLEDSNHSGEEDRFYAVGKTPKGNVLTVRYTWRKNVIRIFGVAEWRKWRKFYETNSKSGKNEKGSRSKTASQRRHKNEN